MADPYPRPETQTETTSDTNDDAAVWDPEEESTSGTRGWIKLLAIILAVLILLFVVLQLIGVGGTHGPSLHPSSVGIGSFAALSICQMGAIPPMGCSSAGVSQQNTDPRVLSHVRNQQWR